MREMRASKREASETVQQVGRNQRNLRMKPGDARCPNWFVRVAEGEETIEWTEKRQHEGRTWRRWNHQMEDGAVLDSGFLF